MKRVHFISVFVLFFNNTLFAQINDIKSFLDQCPTNDPIVDTILKDFEIRLNGNIVTEFPCYEPVSSMNVLNYSNPLIYLQTLRVIYYMDRNMICPHLPWTDTTLYVWMKNRVDGINIRDGVPGGYCCEVINGKTFFVTGNPDESNRAFDKKWIGISGNIDFFVHEVRHTDGNYGHSSCCGISGGCDAEYNENNLGAYGVQYWLIKSWLNGFINVGARTSHTEPEIKEIINWHLSALNVSRTRFCSNIPPVININNISNPLGPIPTLIENRNLLTAKLFPNPINSGDDLTISIPDISLDKIEIFSTTGVLLKVIENTIMGNVIISTVNFKSGIYIIRIQDNNKNLYYRKLVIK
jgi:hypothetical protein